MELNLKILCSCIIIQWCLCEQIEVVPKAHPKFLNDAEGIHDMVTPCVGLWLMVSADLPWAGEELLGTNPVAIMLVWDGGLC